MLFSPWSALQSAKVNLAPAQAIDKVAEPVPALAFTTWSKKRLFKAMIYIFAQVKLCINGIWKM